MEPQGRRAVMKKKDPSTDFHQFDNQRDDRGGGGLMSCKRDERGRKGIYQNDEHVIIFSLRKR